MEPLVRSMMVGRVPFMSSYLVKRPHSAELPAHIDWRLADEPRRLTHGCWVPLTPAATDTGAFGVVPGSHLLVDFDRTPEDPGHEWTAEHVAGGAPTLLLEVEVGRAVVYDHRLVHFSTANDADDERIAVNSGISAEDEEERARELLLDMMRRGMSSAGGSQLDPTADHGAPPTEAASDAADGTAPSAGATGAPAPTPSPQGSGWRRLRRLRRRS
jgi:ectoine hydroxylase-related dioxygenase (phytanoyl-CoA dioxygenase family)